jgi:class 3 adenylate cyclase
MILSVIIIGAICIRNAIKWTYRPFPGFLLNERLEIGGIGQPHWTGTRAGLRSGDRILKANGRIVSSDKDMEKAIDGISYGDSVRYVIERAGQLIEVTVPSMRFTHTDLFMTFEIFLFIGLIYLIIGITVFILKPDSKTSWVFFIVCFLQSITNFTSFDVESTHAFIRAYIFVYALIPAFVLHLSLLFPEVSTLAKKHPHAEMLPYLISGVLIIPVELFYPGPLFKPVFRIIVLYLTVSVAAFIVLTLKAYIKKSSDLARQRAKVVLFGVVLALPFPAVTFFAVNMGFSLAGLKIMTNLTVIPVLIFPASIAYAIAKHNLFDVDVYIKRAVGYGIMTAVVGLTYFAIQVGVRTAFQPIFGEHSEKIYPILFAVLVVFLFNPLNRTVQTAVDKLFYRKKFSYKETVTRVSNALTSMLDLDEVIRKLINTARLEMFIDKAGVLILDEKKKECQTMFIGDETEPVKPNENECIQYDDPFISVLTKNKKLVTIYDINEDPHYRDIKDTCSERFARMGVSMVLPLVYQDTVKGALALGYKKSGHFYTRADIDLLNTLANSGAVAIENAKLVDQIKKEEIIRTNLSRYLSPGVVEDIIHKDVEVNLGGDRKVVTILFMDLIGFTSLSEKLQPEEVVSILNEYFTEMSKGIFKWRGTLDKFAGDQIMAFWGAPFEQLNHAELAVQCALEVSKTLDELQKKWEKEGKPVLNCGIGINTGEVLVGNIGVEGMKMDYTVIGDAVNLAARVEKITRQYESRILITEFTFEHIRNSIDSGRMGGVKFTDLAVVKVKGKEQGVRIYRVSS